MAITNKESGTNVSEIADRIYRISTPVAADVIPGGFTFNQYLIVDDAPLLFHTGLRKMFPFVREAVASVNASGVVTGIAAGGDGFFRRMRATSPSGTSFGSSCATVGKANPTVVRQRTIRMARSRRINDRTPRMNTPCGEVLHTFYGETKEPRKRQTNLGNSTSGGRLRARV